MYPARVSGRATAVSGRPDDGGSKYLYETKRRNNPEESYLSCFIGFPQSLQREKLK
jgi:hypothetical protein